MRITPFTKYSIFFFVASSFLVISCGVKPITEPKTSNQSDNTYTTTIQDEIDKHGTIKIEVDENGKKVNREIIRSKVDSLNYEQLSQVNQFLASLGSDYPSTKDFVFIKYYPGKDRCNSTGMATRNDIGKSTEKFKVEIAKKQKVTNIYICKSKEGLRRWNKGITWKMDAKQIIENTFFEYHYPCSSYVILHKSGLYYAYFGESWTEKQIMDIDMFTYHF